MCDQDQVFLFFDELHALPPHQCPGSEEMCVSEEKSCVCATVIKGEIKFPCNICQLSNRAGFSVLMQKKCNLESGLQELFAGDDVSDLSLIQPVSDGRTSQRGVQSDHCNARTKIQSTFIMKC